MRKLEDRGVIRQFAAIADPTLAGYPVLAFVFVTLSSQARRKAFLAAVGRNASIHECHHVAGDDDYLLKVRCKTMGDLDVLLSDDLKGRMGVARTRTTVVLGSAKETTALPVDRDVTTSRTADARTKSEPHANATAVRRSPSGRRRKFGLRTVESRPGRRCR